jgi:hypothetical protein
VRMRLFYELVSIAYDNLLDIHVYVSYTRICVMYLTVHRKKGLRGVGGPHTGTRLPVENVEAHSSVHRLQSVNVRC